MPDVHRHTTAVLIFARSASEELKHKKITNGKHLFNSLTRRTLKTVKQTGLPFFHLNEEHQKGNSFGERFVNAVQYVFDQGYSSIITLGNDSPHLTKAHIEKTLVKLEKNESTIGPCADGGFYLMGLNRSAFKKVDFEELPWQTSRLKKELVELLSGLGQETTLLPILVDIDTLWDVKHIAKYSSSLERTILKAVQALISSFRKIEIRPIPQTVEHQIEYPFNKGSPFPF